jgi:hypothetical protein
MAFRFFAAAGFNSRAGVDDKVYLVKVISCEAEKTKPNSSEKS